MRNYFLLILLLAGCKTAMKAQAKKPEYEAIQATTEDKVLRLRKYDVEEIARLYKGDKEIDPMIQAIAQERWDIVLDQSMKHLKNYPGNEDALAFLTIGYLGKGQIELAEFYANMIIKGNPRHSMALNFLGLIRRQRATMMEDYREAIGLFNIAHLADPQSSVPLMNAGFVYMEMGNFEAAYGQFIDAKKACGSCLNAVLGAAAAAQGMGRFKEAEQEISLALDQSESDPFANYLLAIQTYYVDGNAAKCRKILNKILASEDPNNEVKVYANDLLTRIENKETQSAKVSSDLLAH